MKKVLMYILLLAVILVLFTGCFTDAQTVQTNLDQQSDMFRVERHIVVTNLRTGDVLYDYQGIFSVQDYSASNELALIIKTSDGVYRKTILSNREDAFYYIEDITGWENGANGRD